MIPSTTIGSPPRHEGKYKSTTCVSFEQLSTQRVSSRGKLLKLLTSTVLDIRRHRSNRARRT